MKKNRHLAVSRVSQKVSQRGFRLMAKGTGCVFQKSIKLFKLQNGCHFVCKQEMKFEIMPLSRVR